MFRRLATVLGVCCPLLVFTASASAVVSYNVTDLGNLGWSYACPFAINDSGQVVGFSNYTSAYYHAFLYSGGTMIALNSTLGGHYSEARDINDIGQVAGYDTLADDNGHACIWTNGVMTDIGKLPESAGSWANAINTSGQVVGASGGGSLSNYHAFLYSAGSMSDISHGHAYSEAFDINASGQIVGGMGATESSAHAFVLSGGTMTDLGPGKATRVNAAGQVVGFDGNYRGFLYSNGKKTDLGTLGGYYATSSPCGINASGQIVGHSPVGTQLTSSTHAFLYSNGAMTDLNTLIDPVSAGGTLRCAYGINDSGVIAARMDDAAGGVHAVLLTPVPEPSTIALLVIGASGLLVWRRYRAA